MPACRQCYRSTLNVAVWVSTTALPDTKIVPFFTLEQRMCVLLSYSISVGARGFVVQDRWQGH
jgi:hypothetical protein